MIKLEMKKAEFMDMIKKMSIPVKSREELFMFPTVTLTIRPDDEIECIGRYQYVTMWVRVKYTTPTEISGPTKITIDASQFLEGLQIMKSNKNMVTFTHYPDQDQNDTLTTEIKRKKERENIEYKFSKQIASEARGMLEELPFRLEKGTDIILFKNGLLKPNISGSCDVQQFKDLVKNAAVKKKSEKSLMKTGKFLKKKRNTPALYKIYIDGENHRIRTVTGKEYDKDSAEDCAKNDSIVGNGELYYTTGFAEVMNVLSGEIKFYAVDKGPLWITQDTDKMKVRYLIAPSPAFIYE